MFFERILLPVLCLAFEALPGSLGEEVEIRDVAADKGTNVTVPCGGLDAPAPPVLWVHRGNRTHHQVLSDGSLLLKHIEADDAGLYECGVENETAFVDRVNLTVRSNTYLDCLTNGELQNRFICAAHFKPSDIHIGKIRSRLIGPAVPIPFQVKDGDCDTSKKTLELDDAGGAEPPPLVNVTVHASTILALILWNVAGDGGHPIIDFTAQYRSAAPVNGSLEPWRPISPNHISPNSRQIDVYHLDTNASYWFRVWATNVLGPGPPVEVLATTLYTDQDAELYKHFLEGAESFDTRTWLAAVCVVMGTLVVLAAGTCAVLCREWRRSECSEEQDVIELVPNIILNPGFMEMEPLRPRERASSIIKCSECPGPGKPRRV